MCVRAHEETDVCVRERYMYVCVCVNSCSSFCVTLT